MLGSVGARIGKRIIFVRDSVGDTQRRRRRVHRVRGPELGSGRGVNSEPGSVAGYVVVTSPDESHGEPEEGVCADYASVIEGPLVLVNMPADVENNPGLLVSCNFGRTGH